MRYVIIGCSTAAIACIEAIREKDREGSITVISSENHRAYGRPTISYYLMGRTKRENMSYRPDSFYEDNAVTLRLGVTAEKIDAKAKEVVISGGERVPYDRLLVATGSRPFVPPAEGAGSVKNSFTFMTLDDALSLEKVLTPSSRVLIVGAGLIGLKCAEGIRDRVGEISVVDLADRVLPSVLDAEGASMVQSFLEGQGLSFFLGDCVVKYDGNTAYLRSGRKTEFDILVTAAGVRANTELVKDIGGKTGKGISVNTYMETGIRDIYAAGDCAEGYDSSINADRVLALLPNAYFQGHVAGTNMAASGSDAKAQLLDAIPMNAVGFFGMHILCAGTYEGECISEVTETNYKKLYVRDGVLSGFILIGDIERAGIYTSLVRNKTPLSGVDFDLLRDAPTLLAFPREYRKEKLSRKV